MADHDANARIYDRSFLLSTAKRNQVMELWEVRKYGIDSYSDPDYVSIYGMPPEEWYRKGIRLLARTTVECTRDSLGRLIGTDVASVIQSLPPGMRFIVVDPFAGSCNSLYWILRHVRNSKGIAFELDGTIFRLTAQNLASAGAAIELVNGDYRSQLTSGRFPQGCFVVVYVAPPWGDALHESSGLDLRRTNPPVAEIVDYVDEIAQAHPIFWVIQVHQTIDPVSLADLTKRFEWWALRVYDINAEGMKHGALFATSRWRPANDGPENWIGAG